MDALPQELISLIIDELPNASLAPYSLVSSRIRVPCQQRIFETLRMSTAADESRGLVPYAVAARKLEGSPHLAKYVKNFELFFEYLRLSLSEEAALTSVLGSVGNVRNIHIQQIHWPILSEPLQGALLSLIDRSGPLLGGRLSLCDLTLFPLGAIARNICNWPSVTLDRMIFSEDLLASHSPPTSSARLRSLVIGRGPHSGIYHLLRLVPQCLSPLKKLSVRGKAAHVHIPLSLLSSCASSIEAFTLICEDRLNEYSLHKILPLQLPKLRELGISLHDIPFVDIAEGSSVVPTFLHDLCAALAPVSGLRRLHVHLRIRAAAPHDPIYILPLSIDLLDDLLVRYLESGTVIEIVVGHLHYYRARTALEQERELQAHMDALEAALREGLSKSVEKGLTIVSKWDI